MVVESLSRLKTALDEHVLKHPNINDTKHVQHSKPVADVKENQQKHSKPVDEEKQKRIDEFPDKHLNQKQVGEVKNQSQMTVSAQVPQINDIPVLKPFPQTIQKEKQRQYNCYDCGFQGI